MSKDRYSELSERITEDDLTVLNEPDISKVTGPGGVTPLHWAAIHFERALDHPEVSKVKDDKGNTPLHFAVQKWIAALQHKDVATVRNHAGETPLDFPNPGN